MAGAEPNDVTSAGAPARLFGDVRLWSVVLAGTWFLCGFGVGHLVSTDRSDPPAAHARYAEELCRAFELDGLRRTTLIDLLEQREIRREDVRRRLEAQNRAAMEPHLRAIDEETEALIRNTILPPSKRAEYDRLSSPLRLGPEPGAPRTEAPAAPGD